MASSSDDKPTIPAGGRAPGPRSVASGDPTGPDSESPTRVDPLHDAEMEVLLSGANVDLRSPFFEDRYRYEVELGKGGMGEVHAYADARTGRTVAVKVATDEPGRDRAAQEAFAARFIHEARVQARLEHPAVVPVYDLGLGASGQPYFTMKRVRGLTFEAVVEGLTVSDPDIVAKFSVRRILTAFSQVCLAIDFAHEKGVLHRDLKPANIIVGDFGEVYVLDWGVASTFDPDADERAEAAEGVGVSGGGTAGYMAPERIEGGERFAPSSDVYGLGAILYELLTLAPLNAGLTPDARAVASLEGGQPPPSERAPERDIAPELDVICMRATALQHRQRFKSARRLYEAVEGYLDGQRDEALRRELAEQHAMAAADAADRALHSVTQNPGRERSGALREVGRALALDPNNEVARETMVRLLTALPDKAPPEVKVAQEQAARQRRVWTGRTAVLAYLSMLTYWPFFLWAGSKDLAPLMVYSALAVVAAAMCAYAVYRKGGREEWVLLVMLVSTAAVGSTVVLFGPLVMMPAAIATNSAAYAMNLSRRGRGVTMAVALASLILPVLAEALGYIRPFYRFAGGEMTIIPYSIEFSAASATALLLAASVGSVLTASLSMGHLRRSLDRAEQRILLYTWHFRKLAPEGVSAARNEAVHSLPPP